MALLDRKKLLEKEKLEVVQVDLGDENFVYVRQMTGQERDRFEQSLRRETKDSKGKTIDFVLALDNFRAKLAVVTVCDEEGNLLLRPEDYLQLSQSMSAARLEKIINVAQRLNAITEEDKEGLIKNSVVGPADISPSDFVESLE